MTYSVACRIGTYCYDEGGRDVWTYPRDVRGNDGWLYNDDIIQAFSYITNYDGLGYTKIEIWWEFTDVYTGEVWEWNRRTITGYSPSDTWSVESWLGNYCASGTVVAAALFGADRMIEARICYGAPVNMKSEPAVLKIGEPVMPICVEGAHEAVEYCADGVTEKQWRDCTNGDWVYDMQPCPRAPPCESYGDVDADGYVTEADFWLINDYIDSGWDAVSGLVPLTEQEFVVRADVNGNGRVDYDDLASVYNYLYERNGTFDVCDVSPSPDSKWIIGVLAAAGGIAAAGYLLLKKR